MKSFLKNFKVFIKNSLVCFYGFKLARTNNLILQAFV